ncbi:MAG: thiamine diphosphokinase [Legionellales bacterium RIFCSPHIGHO2_12_FULL_35_11]|nr:MAG: thiamine diphosphokinase [Legionellales bacterium RIFCSPHIGHO2_12_FULL_35_11]
MQNFLIIANGPFLNKKIISEAMIGKKIIVLDGAADKLLDYNIYPDVIIGDFDSISQTTKKYWGITENNSKEFYFGKNGVLIIYLDDQNTTDLLKAIHYCDVENANSIDIICATGGREDHTEAMKAALQTQYNPKRKIITHTCYQSLRFAKNETIEIRGEAGDYCGVIGINLGKCSSVGLKYELNNHAISTSNCLLGKSAKIIVNGEALVILPPQLLAQRISVC